MTDIRIATADERQLCYDIRTKVFVDEQNVPLDLEIDEHEDECVHFIARIGGEPMGTARLMDKGYAKLQRIAVSKDARGTGLGRALLQAMLDRAMELGKSEARLDAQVYAIPFYEKLGFKAEGPEFDDAGIPHRLMRKKL